MLKEDPWYKKQWKRTNPRFIVNILFLYVQVSH